MFSKIFFFSISRALISCMLHLIRGWGVFQLSIQPRFSRLFLSFLMAGFLILASCDKEEEFMFELDHLLETPWGIPQIIEPGQGDIDLEAPTIFYPDGLVTIGPARTDFWSLRGSRTIILDHARESWFIIDLTPERLYVEKSSLEGVFLVKCFYEPMFK